VRLKARFSTLFRKSDSSCSVAKGAAAGAASGAGLSFCGPARLQAEGVKYLWGYPGGAVLYIYDALYKQDTIQHVLVRHEQAAVHAADGYARATGEVGVALVTSGPGVTNAVTGIATAYMDSIPMVIITGQVPTPPSAWTPSRNATPWASRARSSSTTSWSRTCATWR
jgi:acetolactate synthase-1/2/3 large subunit